VKLRRDSAVSSTTRGRSDTSKEDVTSMMSLDNNKSRESLKDKTHLLEKPEAVSRGTDIPKILVHKTFSREETMESNISDAAPSEEHQQ